MTADFADVLFAEPVAPVKPKGYEWRTVVQSLVFYNPDLVLKETFAWEHIAAMTPTQKLSLYGYESYMKVPGGGRVCLMWDKGPQGFWIRYGKSRDPRTLNSLFGPWQLETVVLPIPMLVSNTDL